MVRIFLTECVDVRYLWWLLRSDPGFETCSDEHSHGTSDAD